MTTELTKPTTAHDDSTPEPERCPVCGFGRENHYDWFCSGFEKQS